jgi:hypothetical protein
MTTFKKTLLFILIVLILGGVFWIYTQQKVVEPKLKSLPQSIENAALKEVINQCGDITERAAAHLVAVVEFQKLEIIGRKARVFKLCMQDHGYIENKYWLTYSQPVAEKAAMDSNISVNEALENLRRADMAIAHGDSDRPVYWVKQ